MDLEKKLRKLSGVTSLIAFMFEYLQLLQM